MYLDLRKSKLQDSLWKKEEKKGPLKRYTSTVENRKVVNENVTRATCFWSSLARIPLDWNLIKSTIFTQPKESNILLSLGNPHNVIKNSLFKHCKNLIGYNLQYKKNIEIFKNVVSKIGPKLHNQVLTNYQMKNGLELI